MPEWFERTVSFVPYKQRSCSETLIHNTTRGIKFRFSSRPSSLQRPSHPQLINNIYNTQTQWPRFPLMLLLNHDWSIRRFTYGYRVTTSSSSRWSGSQSFNTAVATIHTVHHTTQSVEATGGVYKRQGPIQRELMTHIYKEFLVHDSSYKNQFRLRTVFKIARFFRIRKLTPSVHCNTRAAQAI